MSRMIVRLSLFFATCVLLGKLLAMQESKIISVKEFAQKSVPREWSLRAIKITPQTQKIDILAQRFVFESIKVMKTDARHRKIICLATIDAKRYLVTLIIEKVVSLLWAHWDVYSIMGDFEKDETFSDPMYNIDSGELWFKPMCESKASLLPHIFYVFVGRYLVHCEGVNILSQSCYSCRQNVAYQKDANLFILPHYRSTSGHFLCEECGRHLAVIIPQAFVRVDQLILKSSETASMRYRTYNPHSFP
jgi:hypothetical protein